MIFIERLLGEKSDAYVIAIIPDDIISTGVGNSDEALNGNGSLHAK